MYFAYSFDPGTGNATVTQFNGSSQTLTSGSSEPSPEAPSLQPIATHAAGGRMTQNG